MLHTPTLRKMKINFENPSTCAKKFTRNNFRLSRMICGSLEEDSEKFLTVINCIHLINLRNIFMHFHK